MAEEVTTTPDAEVKAPTIETTIETTPEVVTEQTIGEMVEDTLPEEKPRVVDEHIFVAEKKARKAAEKELKSLREQIESGASKQEISESIADIADEHNIDKGFLQKLASTIKEEAEKDLDAKYSSRIDAQGKQEKFEVAYKKAYEVAMERAPEFKTIANQDVIKKLSLLPENSKKNLSQILEETYGNAIQGKRTIETTTPGGGKDPEPLDYNKAQKDSNYFNEIMADPKKKAQYNEIMLKKGF